MLQRFVSSLKSISNLLHVTGQHKHQQSTPQAIIIATHAKGMSCGIPSFFLIRFASCRSDSAASDAAAAAVACTDRVRIVGYYMILAQMSILYLSSTALTCLGSILDPNYAPTAFLYVLIRT